jgi:hypothetical protein
MTLAALQQQQLAAEAAAKAAAEAAKAKNAKPAPKSAKPLVKKAGAAVPKWTCPDDGLMHDFKHGGVEYKRTFAGYIFGTDEDNTYLGKWDEAKNCLDDTVANPFE